jgi:Ca2+/Na+ antiporter
MAGETVRSSEIYPLPTSPQPREHDYVLAPGRSRKLDGDIVFVLVVFVIIVIVLLYAIVRFWYIVIPIAVLSIILFAWTKEKNRQKKLREERELARQAAESARQAAISAQLAEEARCCQEGIRLRELSLGNLESLPNLLARAHTHLDDAQAHFIQGAPSLFWTCIERAASSLASFNRSICEISRNRSLYINLARQSPSVLPQFPIDEAVVTKLAIGGDAAGRMQNLVSQAHRQINFALIFEQRRTSKILIVGFSRLEEAVDQMAGRIHESIDYLGNSIRQESLLQTEALGTLKAEVVSAATSADWQRERLIAEASSTNERQEQVVKMLDDIKRTRRPA